MDLDCPQITQINADFGCSTSNGFGVACVMADRAKEFKMNGICMLFGNSTSQRLVEALKISENQRNQRMKIK